MSKGSRLRHLEHPVSESEESRLFPCIGAYTPSKSSPLHKEEGVEVRDLWRDGTPAPQSFPIQKTLLKHNPILDTRKIRVKKKPSVLRSVQFYLWL